MSAIRDPDLPMATVSPPAFRVASTLASMPADERDLLAQAVLLMMSGDIGEADFLLAGSMVQAGKLSRLAALQFLVDMRVS